MMKETITSQFETATKKAYAESKSLLSAVQEVEKLNENDTEIVNSLMYELAAYDQSTQATQSTHPLAVNQDDLLFANWFQDGFDAAYNHLLG